MNRFSSTTSRWTLAAALASGLLIATGAFAQTQSGGAMGQSGTGTTPGMSQGSSGGMGSGASGSQSSGTASSQSSPALNMSQDNIRELQQKLSENGYSVSVDGKWGPQTQQALQQYQSSQGLNASGTLDNETAQKLGIASAAGNSGTGGSSGSSGSMNSGAMGTTGGSSGAAGSMGSGGSSGAAGSMGSGSSGSMGSGSSGSMGSGSSGSSGGGGSK